MLCALSGGIYENTQLLDVVTLLENLPDRGLQQGQVGTIVEILPPDAFEVEFTDNDGRTYAMLALRQSQFIVLHYKPVQ